MKKIILATIISLFLVTPAFACGGGALTGGSTEVTQLANNVLLGDILGKDAAIAINTANQYTKQLQQYATQLQQYAEAVKSNFSMPFQIYNDLNNSARSIYSTVKGSGEGLFSYANANNWYNDMKSRSGWVSRYQYQQKTSKTAMKVYDDIITKDESEASLAKDVQDRSNNASGVTAAVQAGNEAALLNNAALKEQTVILATKAQLEEDKYVDEKNAKDKALEEDAKYLISIDDENRRYFK